MTALANGLLELPASELRPGDRVSFGDHPGWYRVKHVDVAERLGLVLLQLAAHRCLFARLSERVVAADETAWVQR